MRKPHPASQIVLAMLLTVLTVLVTGCADSAAQNETPRTAADAGTDGTDGTDARVATDAAADAKDGGAVVTGELLTLSVEAVETCGSWEPTHQPGLSHQTPGNVSLGVLSVEFLRSHDDPEPATVPLPERLVELNASEGDELLDIDTGSIPEGSYSHVRVKLARASYELSATAHAVVTAPGTLTIDMALSTHEDAEGSVRSQGDYVATFSTSGQSYDFSGTTPLNCTLSEWGGIAFTSGPDFVVRVPIPGGPVSVDHENPESINVNLTFPVQDTFAWRDLSEPDFSPGVLDLSQPPGPAELPDSLLECHLLMADRCLGEAVNPIHPTWPMPDSTITICSDGAQITPTCPNPGESGYGQDAQYSINSPRYDATNEVVKDEVTGLSWQRDVPAESFDWWEAREYCATLAVNGHEDWRLPSRVELVSLLDFGGLDPTIDLEAFPDTPSDFFWTSSPVPFLNLAYGVRFELGFIYDHDPHGSGRVRCVRGGYDPPSPRFLPAEETVTDRGTGLIWQRAHLSARSWLDALESCESLSLADETDWRLPTLKEQQTIVDDRRLQPSIDVVAFPETPSEWFWSSTPIEFPPDEGWATSYTDGYASIHAFDELHLVRCVRDPS